MPMAKMFVVINHVAGEVHDIIEPYEGRRRRRSNRQLKRTMQRMYPAPTFSVIKKYMAQA